MDYGKKSITSTPMVSVIMSVYKEPEYMLRESIESILEQTLIDFEFIIVLDNPGYSGNELVKEYEKNDERIIIIANEDNRGLTVSLNEALSIARGKYIARMDADDISEKNRLKIQLEYMENNPEITVVGSYVDVFEDQNSKRHCSGMTNNTDDDEVNKIRMLFCNAGVTHSTAFIRRKFLEEKKITYDENMKKSQDYGLWTDIVINGGRVRTIQQILLRYRIHKGQITNVCSAEQKECFKYNVKKQIDLMGIQLSPKEIDLHYTIYHISKCIDVKEYDLYLDKLLKYDGNEYNIKKYREEIYFMIYKDIFKEIFRYHNKTFWKSRYIAVLFSPSMIIKMISEKKKEYIYKKILKSYIVRINNENNNTNITK